MNNAVCLLIRYGERTTMKYVLEETGATKFRVPLPLGRKAASFRACVDGQMGEVIKCYREWKLSGDTQWIKESAAEPISK